jgi:hypothetical protein
MFNKLKSKANFLNEKRDKKLFLNEELEESDENSNNEKTLSFQRHNLDHKSRPMSSSNNDTQEMNNSYRSAQQKNQRIVRITKPVLPMTKDKLRLTIFSKN